jgi:hypothetical protein
MNYEQLFVSGVAFLLGTTCVLTAIMNLDWCFRLPKAQWAIGRWGRGGTRLAFAIIGILLILLGVYIARMPPRATAMSFSPSIKSVYFSGMIGFCRIE